MVGLKVGEYYPVARGSGKTMPETMRVKATGEVRAPKRGEWYLSGAKVEGYQALTNLTTAYHIGVLVHGEIISYWRPIE